MTTSTRNGRDQALMDRAADTIGQAIGQLDMDLLPPPTAEDYDDAMDYFRTCCDALKDAQAAAKVAKEDVDAASKRLFQIRDQRRAARARRQSTGGF